MKKESEKKIAIIAISLISLVVIAIWSFNLRNVWKPSVKKEKEKAAFNFRDQLDQTIKDINRQQEDRDKRLIEKKQEIGQEFVDDMLTDIKKKADEAPVVSATSTASSTPIATSTKNDLGLEKLSSACPQYINCMPMIGQTVNCNIPAGCEGKTELIY
jgi:hypothetical protein